MCVTNYLPFISTQFRVIASQSGIAGGEARRPYLPTSANVSQVHYSYLPAFTPYPSQSVLFIYLSVRKYQFHECWVVPCLNHLLVQLVPNTFIRLFKQNPYATSLLTFVNLHYLNGYYRIKSAELLSNVHWRCLTGIESWHAGLK